MKIIMEASGKRYGLWEVINYTRLDKNRNAMFRCKCHGCDEFYNVRGFTLRTGKSKSCRKCNWKNRGR